MLNYKLSIFICFKRFDFAKFVNHMLHMCVSVIQKQRTNFASILVNKSINIRQISNLGQFQQQHACITTCLSKSQSTFLSRFRHLDEHSFSATWCHAKKGMYQLNLSRMHFGQQHLPTCWHRLSPISLSFFGFSDVTLQYSISCFIMLIIIFEKLVKYVTLFFFTINCFIAVY